MFKIKAVLLTAAVGLNFAIGTFSAADAFADSPQPGTYLMPGEYLLPNDRIFSPNGIYMLRYDLDGNVVLYQCSVPFCPDYGPVTGKWYANTYNNTPGLFDVDPRDGFIHVWSKNSRGVYFESAYFGGASGNCGGNYLKLQDDGNLVIYQVSAPTETANYAVWASKNTVGWNPNWACPGQGH